MDFLAILLVLGLIIGAVLGWVSFLKISALQRELSTIKKQFESVLLRFNDPGTFLRAESELPGEETSSQTKLEQGEAPDQWTETAAAETSLSGEVRQSDVSWQGPDGDDKAEAAAESDGLPPAASLSVSAAWIEHLKEQWMAWLGGLCVGLAGIFLVRYSIEQGYLGPTARITLALVTGIALHVAAEWLRRRSVGQFQALAALAGGASITLFAALLAALHLYQLMSPLLVFVLLTIVSLITMALAVIHGPLLAIMGLLGAYAVPILVDTGSGSITGVLLYALVISSSALALMHFVYRYWIWVGMLLGSLSWWFLSLLTSDADTVRGFYLAALSYLVIAGPTRDWTLVKEDWLGDAKARIPNWRASDDVASAPVRNSILVILLAYGLSIYSQAYSYSSSLSAIYYWTPQIILLFLASRQKVTMTWLPWAPMAVHCVAWFATGLGYRSGTLQIIGPSGAEQIGFLNLAGWMSVVYFALSLWLFRMHQNQTRWIALALVSPLLWLALSYLLVAGIAQSWVWGSIAIVIGLVYLALAGCRLRQGEDAKERLEITIWLILAGHFAYSLAVAIILREAGLTLALSAQLLSLAWVIKRFELQHLSLLLKCVLAVVVIRLTTNPWLLTYSADIHWSLWTYGGATVFCGLAAWQIKKADKLRQWLEAATLHLLVLTLWAETRYWLYDGEIFSPRFELMEVAINTALWSSLGLVYFLRSKVSENLAPLYVLLSKILLVLSLGFYGIMLTSMNPYWSAQQLSTTPVFNVLLLAYGFPIVISVLIYRYYDEAYKKYAAMLAGAAAFIFITMEIRHLWQGRPDVDFSTSNGELYTYSIVWLVMAVLSMLAGGARYGIHVYRAGMLLLFVVIAKLFLIDMADLDGLLRVASFMGLGLSLLGLAYLYQRFNFKHRAQSKQA